MKKNKVTLFVDGFNIDCSIWLEGTQLPMGISRSIIAYITGDLIDEEQVIIDFGTVKKRIKKAIDDNLDHKCLIQYKPKDGEGVFDYYIPDNIIECSTDQATGFVQVPYDFGYETGTSKIRYTLEDYLTILKSEIAILGNKITRDSKGEYEVDLQLVTHTTMTTPLKNAFNYNFSYVHGLPTSTSTPCQFALHGHSSIVSIKPLFRVDDSVLKIILDNILNNGSPYFNIFCDKMLKGVYTHVAKDRGVIIIDYATIPENWVHAIGKHSTIENIVQWLGSRIAEEFRHVDNNRYKGERFDLYVAEGTTKGAIINKEI